MGSLRINEWPKWRPLTDRRRDGWPERETERPFFKEGQSGRSPRCLELTSWECSSHPEHGGCGGPVVFEARRTVGSRWRVMGHRLVAAVRGHSALGAPLARLHPLPRGRPRRPEHAMTSDVHRATSNLADHYRWFRTLSVRWGACSAFRIHDRDPQPSMDGPARASSPQARSNLHVRRAGCSPHTGRGRTELPLDAYEGCRLRSRYR